MSNIVKAIQTIYPEIEGGFVYWETNQNGSSFEDPIDGLVWTNDTFPKPTWEQIASVLPSIELQETKERKIKLVKEYRDSAMSEPTPRNGGSITYMVNNQKRVFSLKSSDIPYINAIIDCLSRAFPDSTRGWTDIDGNRLNLNIVQFRSLMDHILARDDFEYTQATKKIDAINALNSLESVEAFDISEVIL
jgi:hypothetical protein